MALRGSLSEFELPNIFQLIANDGKTGQLVIYNKEEEAFVIFSRGKIIAAGNGNLNQQSILFKYLMTIRRYSEKELNELLYLCNGEMKLFTHELIEKKYLAREELKNLAKMSMEDLTCSLFLWERGHYRFDSLENVEDYMTEDISMLSDAVTMEAMRRVDDWKRIRKEISPDTVFIPVKSNVSDSQLFSEMDPAAYILSLVDGITNVETICSSSFFSEYRIYETLLNFWQNNRIIPFKKPHFPAKAAQKSSVRNFPALSVGTISFIMVHFILVIIIVSGLIINHNFLNQKTSIRQQSECELRTCYFENKIRIAALYYQSIYGYTAKSSNQLYDAGIVSSKDK
jgi:hypothetical protein